MLNYKCTTCKRTETLAEDEKPPKCCGRTMKRVSDEICLQPSHSEHARPMEKDDACDEGRSGL